MFITRSLLLILVFCACAQAQAICPDNSLLVKKLVTALKVKAPEWKLTRKFCQQDERDIKSGGQAEEGKIKYKFISLTYGEEPHVGILIYVSDSLEDIHETYENSKNGLTPGDKITVLKESVEGLGDENYTWQSDINPEYGVTFRKGKVTVTLSSSSMNLAKIFAQYLESEL